MEAVAVLEKTEEEVKGVEVRGEVKRLGAVDEEKKREETGC